MYPFNKNCTYWVHPVLARRQLLSDGDLLDSIHILDKEASFYLMAFDTFGYKYNSVPSEPQIQQLSAEREKIHMKLRKAMCRQYYREIPTSGPYLSFKSPLTGKYLAGDLVVAPSFDKSIQQTDYFVNSLYRGYEPVPMDTVQLQRTRKKIMKAVLAARRWMSHYCIIPGDLNGNKCKFLYKSMGVRILEEELS
jgi:hypothetical protein